MTKLTIEEMQLLLGDLAEKDVAPVISEATLARLDAEYRAIVQQWAHIVATLHIPALGQDSAMEVADDYQS